MTTRDLEDFERAFDRVERQLTLDRDWGRTEALIQRRLKRPAWGLVRTAIAVGLGLVVGALGSPVGWGLAGGIALAALPGQLADLRQRRRALAAVETAEDVRALVAREARLRMAGSFARALVMAALGLIYGTVGVVAWFLEESPWPGLVAGGVVCAWSAVLLLVVFPRAARESSLLNDEPAVGGEGEHAS